MRALATDKIRGEKRLATEARLLDVSQSPQQRPQRGGCDDVTRTFVKEFL